MIKADGAVAALRSAKVGYWLFASHLFAIFSIAASNALLGLSLLTAPLWRSGERTPLPAAARRWSLLLGLYILLLVVSIALSYQPRVSLRSASEIFNLATPFLALFLVRGERAVRRIVFALILLATLLAVVGLVQYQLGWDNLDQRIRGPLSHYMTFAGILLLGDCLLLAWMACGGGARRIWAWAALLLINLALLGSFTRNAWVALVVVLTVLACVRMPKLLLAYIPVAVLLVVLAPPPIVERVTSITDLEDPSNYDRLCMTYAGLHMIAERPLFGLGPEMVSHRYPIYRHPTAPRYWVPHLHSSFLNLTAERGLTSLAALLAVLGYSALWSVRRLRAEGGVRGPRADLYLGVLLAVLAITVGGLFEDYWADTEVQRVVLFLLAVPFCLTSPDAGPGPEGAAEPAT